MARVKPEIEEKLFENIIDNLGKPKVTPSIQQQVINNSPKKLTPQLQQKIFGFTLGCTLGVPNISCCTPGVNFFGELLITCC